MKTGFIDIFNTYSLEVRNNSLNTHTQCRRSYNQKMSNKKAARLFIYPILYPFFLLIFTCIPVAVCAGEIMKCDFDYEIGVTFPILPILLVLSLLMIIVLSVSLYHYKRKLRSTQEYLVRYINYCLELKRHVPTSEQPYSFNPPKITGKEFIKIIDNMLKRIMFLPLFILFVLPLGAQEKADSVYEVDRYCNRLPNEAENLNVAKLRSNRVKSELILHEGVKEELFVTRNHAEKGDRVVVRIPISAPPQTKSELFAIPETEQTEDEKGPEAAENKAITTIETVRDEQPTAETEVIKTSEQGIYPFAIRANLLRWATLTPDLGIEWRINRHIGILVDGSWTSWSWSDKDRRYALWKVSPEVRYYIGKEKRGFLGAMYHIGEFNYKLGNTGRQGDYQGGGITGGYTLELNRALILDFHAALGYTYADYEKYKVINGVRVRTGSGTKNYWGINQLGVTLVWKLTK